MTSVRIRLRVPSEKVKVELKPGSLLVMSGDIQEKWQHSLPRRKNVTAERINVTFRTVKRTST